MGLGVGRQMTGEDANTGLLGQDRGKNGFSHVASGSLEVDRGRLKRNWGFS